MKLVILLYADEMVLFAESIEELQDLLDTFRSHPRKNLFRSSYTFFMQTTMLQLSYLKVQVYMHSYWIFKYLVNTKDKYSVRLYVSFSDNSDLCCPQRYGQCSNWKCTKID